MGIPENQAEVLLATAFEAQDEQSKTGTNSAAPNQSRFSPGPSNPGPSNQQSSGVKAIPSQVRQRYQPY